MLDEPGMGRQQRVQKMEADYSAMMRTLGVVVRRGGEVLLVDTVMPHLVTDARAWAASLIAGMRPKIAALDVDSNRDAARQRDVLDGLDAWLSAPAANAHRIQWLLPLAERQRFLPDVLTIESGEDMARFVSALLGAARDQKRVDLTASFGPSSSVPLDFETRMQQLERGGEALLVTRGQLFPNQTIEWVLTEGASRSGSTDGHEPSLLAHPRLTMILETCSPYLTACVSGEEAELALIVANEAFQGVAGQGQSG